MRCLWVSWVCIFEVHVPLVTDCRCQSEVRVFVLCDDINHFKKQNWDSTGTVHLIVIEQVQTARSFFMSQFSLKLHCCTVSDAAKLLYCKLSCLPAILHCTAFLETAPLNATGCKIKDIITPCTFGEAVKLQDMCFLNCKCHS